MSKKCLVSLFYGVYYRGVFSERVEYHFKMSKLWSAFMLIKLVYCILVRVTKLDLSDNIINDSNKINIRSGESFIG